MVNNNDIETLFKAHYTRMHRIAIALLHDEDAARDIVHEVFASLLDSNSSKIVSGSYLITAVRNRCLNYIRDFDIHKRIENRYFTEDEEYESEKWPNEETIARINEIITQELSQPAQKIIELRFIEGMPFAKIANVMGISETAVYRHLRQALIKIRNKIND